MNESTSLKSRLRAALGLAIAGSILYMASIVSVSGADSTPEKDVKPETKTEKKTDKKKKLSGGELYAIHCSRCHAERYATEFTAAQWKTLMTHMRVRANLPAAQAKAILKYLQEDSGS